MAKPASESATLPGVREAGVREAVAGGARPARTIRIVAEGGHRAAPRPPAAPMVRAPSDTQPYRAYRSAPFTAAERGQATVLFGGLHWRVERLLQGVLENMGHKAQILPTATLSDLMAGREAAIDVSGLAVQRLKA
jgi:hypothetical protein